MTVAGSSGTTGSDFDPIAFLEDAVQLPSHEDVGPMRDFLVETLETSGVAVSVDEVGNVFATRGGAVETADEDDTHVLLNTHIDTVTPHVPFERDDDAGVIRGRGSCDAKGPLAAYLAAFLTVDLDDRAGASDHLSFLITPDEEVGSTGAHAFVSEPHSPIRSADGVIVGEPTGLDVCTAAKGRFEGTIVLSGANAHAAEPETGVNAVAALEPVLHALRTFDDRSDVASVHPVLGASTLTPTVVEGGEAVNQVPDVCRLRIDRRSVPPETTEDFQDALVEHLREAVPADVSVDFAFTERPTPFLEAWATDHDAPLVGTLQAASRGDVRPFTAATEASYFAAHVPTVVFGPGVLADDEGAVAHSPREYVRIDEVRAAADAVEATLQTLFD